MKLIFALSLLFCPTLAFANGNLLQCGLINADFDSVMVKTKGNPMLAAEKKVYLNHGDHLEVSKDGTFGVTKNISDNPEALMHVQVTNWNGIGIQIASSRGYAFSKSQATYFDAKANKGIVCEEVKVPAGRKPMECDVIDLNPITLRCDDGHTYNYHGSLQEVR